MRRMLMIMAMAVSGWADPGSDPVSVIAAGEPEALYIGTDRAVIGLLVGAGFAVKTARELPDMLEAYRVIVLSEYSACHQGVAERLEVYLRQGGGLVMTDGAPAYFPYATSQESAEGQKTGIAHTDLSSISEWFGARRYVNVNHAEAVTVVENPFGTGLALGAVVTRTGRGGAAVAEVDGDAHVVAGWGGSEGPVCAFARSYGSGRLYYQSGSLAPEVTAALRLFHGGVRWAACCMESRRPGPCLCGVGDPVRGSE